MALLERPTRPAPRAWILVACVAPIPMFPGLLLDANGLFLVASAFVCGLIGMSAAVVWAVQRSTRQRREYEARLTEWAAERAVTQERLRIARDLHDLSSHGLGIITVCATSTSFLDGPDADRERQQAMRDIERVSRQTMMELRRMLTLLRTPSDTSAPLRPADTLATLPAILADAERHGLIIRFEGWGTDDEGDDAGVLSQGVQLTACTVVREALANALRHAGPTTVTVSVVRARDSVTVEVRDDGPHPGWRAEPGAGYGLSGLHERLSTHGGTLTAAPDGNGFRVRAMIPAGAAE
jgi:signal transduction histidine kinase